MLERLYRSLFLIRRVEEEIARVYPTDKIKSPVHLSIGQEAVAAGVCLALDPDDVVFGTYRSHAVYLAKGGDLRAMIAELYGKAAGCAKGKGGSMHLVDAAHGIMGTSAVVGTSIPNAVGYAYAVRYMGKKTVVSSFFGDGAVDEGVFSESLNFASLKRLPLIFVCENNLYAIHTRQERRQAVPDICARARSFGIPAERIEANDVLAIHEKVKSAADRLRAGEKGPFFFECMTYRWKEHVGPSEDYHLGFRTREEAAPWMENDQVARIAALLPTERRTEIEREIEERVKDAFARADASPFPDEAELFTDVFRESEEWTATEN
jgi:TPP-dependent pyruvate/acetoin dehydrogenase alpha subunit